MMLVLDVEPAAGADMTCVALVPESPMIALAYPAADEGSVKFVPSALGAVVLSAM
jgi:hypothetical protein